MSRPEADLVVHKATRECPMTEPHRREICGLVRARERSQGHPPPPPPPAPPPPPPPHPKKT